VFLDTHGLLAVLNADDAHHDAAAALFNSLADDRTPVFTSDWVLAEFLSVAARRTLRAPAAAIADDLRSSPLTTVLPATRTGWDQAFRLFRSRKDKEWSFVDCTSIMLCNQFRITGVVTNDHHFAQAGLRVLL
jgi:predicted nucleic acid-binding protein